MAIDYYQTKRRDEIRALNYQIQLLNERINEVDILIANPKEVLKLIRLMEERDGLIKERERLGNYENPLQAPQGFTPGKP